MEKGEKEKGEKESEKELDSESPDRCWQGKRKRFNVHIIA